MIAEQLKKAVLQAAIQGKLTEQLPEDGDARDLLKEIRLEKARLVKEGKLKKEKPFPETSEDEIPFDIPENWVWVRLIDITSALGDGIHGTPIYDDFGEYFFINGNNLNDGIIDIKNNTKRVSIEEYKRHEKPLNNSSVLVSINGTLGNVAFFNGEKVVLGKSACYFNLFEGILKYFIKYLLNSEYFLEYANYTSTGTTIRNVSLNALRMLPMPLPPLAEQQRIVERLEEVLPEIDQLALDENKLYELEKVFPKKMKDAILQYAIQGKLTDQRPEDGDARDLLKEIRAEKARLVKAGKLKKENPLPEISEDEKPFDIPENWTWCRLNEIVWLGNGEKKAGLTLPYLEARVLRGQENGSYKTSGEVVFSGERVILVDGENSGEVFKIPHDGYLGSTYKKLFFASENVIPYILFFLKKYQNLFKNNKTGSAIPHLNKSLFRELLIPLPPLTEQQRIVERLEHLLPLCEKLE